MRHENVRMVDGDKPAPPKRVSIVEIEVKDRYRTDMGDIPALAASIKDVGLLQPIVVDERNRLIAGARRLAAVKLLGWKRVPVRYADCLDDAIRRFKMEWDENTCRKDFTPEEAARLGMLLERVEAPKARERQAVRTPKEEEDFTSGKLPEVNGRVGDKVAEVVGMSGSSYEKAKKVVKAADADPSKRPLVDEMVKTGKVDGVYKKLRESEGEPAGGKKAKKQASKSPPADAGTATEQASEPPVPPAGFPDAGERNLEKVKPYLDAFFAYALASRSAKTSIAVRLTGDPVLREWWKGVLGHQ